VISINDISTVTLFATFQFILSLLFAGGSVFWFLQKKEIFPKGKNESYSSFWPTFSDKLLGQTFDDILATLG